MPDLFGLDIATIIADNIGPQLRPVSISRAGAETTPADGAPLTGPPARPPPTMYTGRGFWSSYDPDEVDGNTVQVGDRKALLIVNTFKPAYVPKYEDVVTIDGTVLVLVRVESSDPAAATYTVQCRDRKGSNTP